MDDPLQIPVPDGWRRPLSGVIRAGPEDFQVEELPLYRPSGEGEHVMAFVEKRALSTPAMVARVARALGVAPRSVGFAGYKDKHALTRQWISVQGVEPSGVRALDLPGIRVLEAERHRNKLRTGHLRGNRFIVTVRGSGPDAAVQAREVLAEVRRRGLPNGFGPQRFGNRRENHLLGEFLLRGDSAGFMDRLCTPRPGLETPRNIEARTRMAAGDWQGACRVLAPDMTLERHVARRLARRPGDLEGAVAGLPVRARTFLVSAWQSAVFNGVLHARMEAFDTLLEGDVAMKHANGACFLVGDPEAEAARAAELEISPTGPLPGRRMLRPTGPAARVEEGVLEEARAESLLAAGGVPARRLRGDRRPLRVPVPDAGAALSAEGHLVLRFTLPRGSFATSLLALFGLEQATAPKGTSDAPGEATGG